MYFQTTYEASRQAFLTKIEKIKEIFPNSIHQAHLMPPDNKEELYTDSLYIPMPNTNKLILITSGVHGIEGYTGSAIQQMFLDKMINHPEKEQKASFLFVHSVNPFGHKNYRRVNENNVDLNRSFVSSEKVFSKSYSFYNKAYADMESFLNPTTPYTSKAFEKLRFVLKAFKNISNNSIKAFRQAILQGQYEFEKGIFFGGKTYQAQKGLFDQLIETYFVHFNTIIHIDIHTGYGYRAQLHLIGMDNYPDEGVFEKLAKLYPNDKLEQADKDQGDFYKIEGSLFDYIYNKGKKIKKTILPVAWEFGTNDNIKTLKSIESLRIILQENQVFHYGVKHENARKKISDAYRNLFYPDSKDWQQKVLEKAQVTFDLLLKQLK